jgi:hypothetical protein
MRVDMTKLCIILLVCMAAVAETQPVKDVTGDWEGESLCTIKDSPCHDEHVIYHITRDKNDAAKLEISANKLVNGEELYMGSLECMFTEAKQELNCHYRKDDQWVFKVEGDKMTGTLVVPENRLYRKISVERKRARPQ